MFPIVSIKGRIAPLQKAPVQHQQPPAPSNEHEWINDLWKVGDSI